MVWATPNWRASAASGSDRMGKERRPGAASAERGFPTVDCVSGSVCLFEVGVLLEMLGREGVLTAILGGDGGEDGAGAADLGVEVAPGLEFGDAVGAPAAAKEVENEGAEGQEVGGAHGLAGGGVGE